MGWRGGRESKDNEKKLSEEVAVFFFFFLGGLIPEQSGKSGRERWYFFSTESIIFGCIFKVIYTYMYTYI